MSNRLTSLCSLPELRRHFFSRSFLIFLLIGGINTFDCTVLASFMIWTGMDGNLAFNIGYIISNMIAYWLNSVFLFPEPLQLARYGRFFVSYIPNYLIQNVIVFVVYNLLGLPSVVSFLLAAIIGLPVTFLLVKLFAFQRR
jgi:putative flippase GtrA